MCLPTPPSWFSSSFFLNESGQSLSIFFIVPVQSNLHSHWECVRLPRLPHLNTSVGHRFSSSHCSGCAMGNCCGLNLRFPLSNDLSIFSVVFVHPIIDVG